MMELRPTHTRKEIAIALGRTFKSVTGHLGEMKTRKPPARHDYAAMPKEVLAYAAGIIDGEGHIGIVKAVIKQGVYFNLRTEVANTSSVLCEFLQTTFGGNIVVGHRPNRKIYYRWMLASRQADEFLRSIHQYCLIKRNQVDLAIRFRLERDRSKHQAMYEEMKRLHKYD